jgi:hypothetical protein
LCCVELCVCLRVTHISSFHNNRLIYFAAAYSKQYRLCQDDGINSTSQPFRHRPLNIACHKLSNPVWENILIWIRIRAETGTNVRRTQTPFFFICKRKKNTCHMQQRMCKSQYNRSWFNKNSFHLFSVECTHCEIWTLKLVHRNFAICA